MTVQVWSYLGEQITTNKYHNVMDLHFNENGFLVLVFPDESSIAFNKDSIYKFETN